MRDSTSTKTFAWLLAIAAGLAAMGLRSLAQPYLHDRLPLVLALPAVWVVAWRIGSGPALLTGIVCLGWTLVPGLVPHLEADPVARAARALPYLFLVVASVLVMWRMRSYGELIAQRAIEAREHDAMAHRLSLAEQRFSRMADTSPNVVYVYNLVTSRNVYANRRFTQLLGLPPLEGDELGDRIHTLVHPADVENVRRGHDLLRRADDSEVIEYEFRLRHANGRWIWFRNRSTVFSREPDGSVREILGNGEDITARRDADEALAESERRFARIAETMADVLYIHDLASRRYIYVNARVKSILGYTPEYIQGLKPHEVIALVHPEHHGRVRQRRSEYGQLVNGQTHEIEYLMRHSEGHFRWISSRETIFARDERGNPTQILGVAKDVSEVRASREALEESARRKDEFLAMLAHELRNPLAPIRNAAEVIRLADPAPSRELNWAREVIERQSAHMARLVDDLLDVSRTTTGKVTLRREVIEVTAAVHRAVELCRPLIESRRQHIALAAHAEALYVDVDPARLTQVIGNLVNNAAKYSEERAIIRVSSARVDGQVVVRVSDEGMGIAPEFLPHVFDLFRQGNRAIDRSQGGLGIGLTLVKSLVELHGGSVEAESGGPGQGSTFTVRLPEAAPPERGSPVYAKQTLQAGPGPGLAVLVVDDNVDSAETLRLVIEARGFAVTVRHDGHGALQALEAQAFAVAILDLGLPGLDGYEVARRARRLAQPPLLIALTGYGQAEDRGRALDAGFQYHFVKPTEPDALGALLESVAAQRRQELTDAL